MPRPKRKATTACDYWMNLECLLLYLEHQVEHREGILIHVFMVVEEFAFAWGEIQAVSSCGRSLVAKVVASLAERY
jgi:hypothetical protein